MPLTLNLMTEMSKCLSSGCGKLRPSRVQSVVSSQGSMDSDMQGKCCAKMNDGWAAWLALEMFEEWGGCDKLEILRVISCQIQTYRMKATHKMQVYSHTRHQNNTWLCFPVYQHVTRQMIWVGPTRIHHHSFLITAVTQKLQCPLWGNLFSQSVDKNTIQDNV